MKVSKLLDVLNHNKVDAMIITSEHNRFYLSGFTGSSATLFISKDVQWVFTDFRYIQQATTQCKGFKVLNIKDYPMLETINQFALENSLKAIGFEGDDVSYNTYEGFNGGISAELKSVDLSNLRIIKTEDELAIMQKACDIADETFEYVVRNTKVGMSETEVEQMAVAYMKKLGASKESFTTIVASGWRGALPHGVASDKIIQENELVTLDFGAIYKGYCSDETRTFATGKDIDPKLLEIYHIVKEAQETSLAAIKPGMVCEEIDQIARSIIEEAGYGQNFGHGLGHGLGVLVHENPRFSPGNKVVLEPGMVLTVEPGIYIEGLGGVRIEDDVVVTKTGVRRLTNASKDLKYIGE